VGGEVLSLDLGFDDAQQAIADALEQFCADRCDEASVKATAGKFPRSLWTEIAELGVLALATPDGDGGAVEAVAACEALGGAVFPGPLMATFFATQVLAPGDRTAVSRGEAVVSVGEPPLMPWAPEADLFIEIADGRAWQCSPVGAVEPLETLGGEPWGRVEVTRTADLGPAERGLAFYDLTLAAYVAAAGRRLVEATAEHARTRKQFGRAIGEFQAVAHPLADCSMHLSAAAGLARIAACEFDDETARDSFSARARSAAAAARLSASRSGVFAAHTCHQLFGALGITTEGPVFHRSRRIRQLASQPPGEAAARESLLGLFGAGGTHR
jgi:alkylation response protein AidB-like acyl-CoA dehydrogenase